MTAFTMIHSVCKVLTVQQNHFRLFSLLEMTCDWLKLSKLLQGLSRNDNSRTYPNFLSAASFVEHR